VERQRREQAKDRQKPEQSQSPRMSQPVTENTHTIKWPQETQKTTKKETAIPQMPAQVLVFLFVSFCVFCG
jgi:hypothetical protein